MYSFLISMIISESISLIMVITTDWESLKPEDESGDDLIELLPKDEESAKNRKDDVSVYLYFKDKTNVSVKDETI